MLTKNVDGVVVECSAQEEAAIRAEWAANAAQPTAGTIPPQMTASALGVQIADGDVAAVDGMFNTAGAEYLAEGNYRLWFMTEQPDEAYFVTFSGDAPIMTATIKTVEYFEIEARDSLDGQPVDASQFSVQVFRF